ncbi:PfkB family carbohydrate kinase [Martelella sp. HB161492]|uniref:carbohydrate kinase family protein n=1 Tax=Martelella sp. HB161492 TaxID=2720726 RepID=UPI00158FC972|nr:PfkB family carbohydrate kinase [Martelella sp. HB161492]
MNSVDDDMQAVLCVGRLYCDLIFTGIDRLPVLGREVFADNLTIAAGGGAFISAAHLRDLGRSTAIVSRLGNDTLSKAVEQEIVVRDIETGFIERAHDAGPQITVASVIGSERAFLTRRAGKAEPATLDAALAWPGAAHLHIAEYATLAEIPDLVARAKHAGLTVSLDPSWDDDLIRDTALIEKCKGVDIFLPNLEEAREITGETQAEAMREHLARYFPIVALKAGASGALVATDQARLAMPAEDVRVVDTTGAGDAFNAGFIDGWMRGAAIEDCLVAAIRSGSRAVQVTGGAVPR